MQFECLGILNVILSLKVICCICSCTCFARGLLSCFWWLGSCQAVIATVCTSCLRVLGCQAEGRAVNVGECGSKSTFLNNGPNPSLYNSSLFVFVKEHNKQHNRSHALSLHYTPLCLFLPYFSLSPAPSNLRSHDWHALLLSSGFFCTMWLNVNISIFHTLSVCVVRRFETLNT